MNTPTKKQQPGLPTPVMDASGEILAGADQVRDQIRQATKILSPEFSSELNLMHKITGFGRRVVVPANQIHAVRAAGLNKYARLSTETRFFGIDSADTSMGKEESAGIAIYWLNDLTEVIVLGTESFTIPIPAIVTRDADQVRLTITAHAMASLDPRAVSKAAKKIGQNAEDLINSIVQVVISALVTQAAHMRVREMIANYTQLSEAARPEIHRHSPNWAITSTYSKLPTSAVKRYAAGKTRRKPASIKQQRKRPTRHSLRSWKTTPSASNGKQN